MDGLTGMDAHQLRVEIVRPALKLIGLHSVAAENLVMGTAATESHLDYVVQLGDGPALGLFQMEGATHDDIWTHYLAYRNQLVREVKAAIKTSVSRPDAERMVWDIRYATLMCRLHYRRRPEPLPDSEDVEAMAQYWKAFYNTELGKGTVEQFVDDYKRVV